MHTLLPSIEDTLIKTYTLAYKVSYGRTVGKWTEEKIASRRHKSQVFKLDYVFGASKQEVGSLRFS